MNTFTRNAILITVLWGLVGSFANGQDCLLIYDLDGSFIDGETTLFKASQEVQLSSVHASGSDIEVRAGNSVLMSSGFSVAIGAVFRAFIADCTPTENEGVVTGELKEWHKVTVTFDGPETSELDNNNPFLDYRLNVTFTSPAGEALVVPGYFAADGDAANSHASSGNKWRAHISPNMQGLWTYTTSFKTGDEISISLEPNEGTAVDFDGATGSFTIAETDKNDGIDLRGKGRLSYVNEHYLQFEGSGEYFIKVGADAPENMLAYDDFDGTTDIKNNRKSWALHQQDYVAADASDYTWDGNNGTEILGAVTYLADQGMNVFSFLTFNVEGDDENVFPHVKSGNGNSWNNDFHKTRMDVSKLDQWEKVFEFGDKKGMYLHFKTTEKENDIFMDGGPLGVERKLYYRELIARFGHHLALNWNMGEEVDVYDTAAGKGIGDTELTSVIDWAQYLKDVDPYDHNIVIHTPKSAKQKVYPFLLGDNSALTGASLQCHYSGNNNAHDDVKEWLERSELAGKKWIVCNDEQGDGGIGVTVDAAYNGDLPQNGSGPDNRKEVRHRSLWATLLAGGAGIEYYYGGSTGCGDTKCQDHRTRATKWQDAKIALDFFHSYLMDHLLDLKTNDDLTTDNDDYVFAQPGEIYVIYLPNGGTTAINLGNSNNSYDIKWYNPRSGGSLQDGSKTSTAAAANVNIGTAPADQNDDWVVLITKS